MQTQKLTGGDNTWEQSTETVVRKTFPPTFVFQNANEL